MDFYYASTVSMLHKFCFLLKWYMGQENKTLLTVAYKVHLFDSQSLAHLWCEWNCDKVNRLPHSSSCSLALTARKEHSITFSYLSLSSGPWQSWVLASHEILGKGQMSNWLLLSIQELSFFQTSQELRMLSSVTINCQVTKIVIYPGSQLSVL